MHFGCPVWKDVYAATVGVSLRIGSDVVRC
jgi:hypothetical protein